MKLINEVVEVDNLFYLVTEMKGGRVETAFTKQNILQIILLMYKRRWNKQLGRKFAVVYLEKYGKEGIEEFARNGIDAEQIKQEYEEKKMIYGGLR